VDLPRPNPCPDWLSQRRYILFHAHEEMLNSQLTLLKKFKTSVFFFLIIASWGDLLLLNTVSGFEGLVEKIFS
jgi:hypothetical protein